MIRGLLILVLAAGLGAVPASAQERAPQGVAADSTAPAPDVVLGVDGLACPFCAYGLEKKLKKLAGVDRIEVLLEGGEVHLFLKAGRTVTDAQLRAAVKDAGFSVREIKRAAQGSPVAEERGVTPEGAGWRVVRP